MAAKTKKPRTIHTKSASEFVASVSKAPTRTAGNSKPSSVKRRRSRG